MRKQIMIVKLGFGIAILGVSSMALALGVGDLAKVVLGNGSVLKKADQKCGTTLGLTSGERGSIESAFAAARSALKANEFSTLSDAATAAADDQAESSTFCNDTKKKKKGLLSKMGGAAKGLFKKRLGF
jgi:hypothetical protein